MQATRIANAVFWFAVWMAIALNFNSVGDPARLIGEAVIPAILWIAIEVAIRRRNP